MTEQMHTGHDGTEYLDEAQNIAEHIINIAINSALMCNVGFGHVGPDPTSAGQRQLVWTDGIAKRLIADAFPKTNNRNGQGRLPRTFHVCNLEQLGSIRVRWTRNLILDRLCFHDPVEQGAPTTVSIFHYAQFLQSSEKSNIFPEGFVSETIKTLALLFPGHVGDTINWFQEQQKGDEDLHMSTCLATFRMAYSSKLCILARSTYHIGASI